MEVNNQLIEYLSQLAKLKFDKKSAEKMKGDLTKIINFIDKLSEINTQNVKPLIYLNEENNVLRKDEVSNESKQEEALKNEAMLQKEKYNNYEMIFEENVQEEDEKLFGSITLQTVLDRLKEDGFEVLKKQVNLPSGPIKVLGNDFIVNVSLHPEVSITIPLKVVKKV